MKKSDRKKKRKPQPGKTDIRSGVKLTAKEKALVDWLAKQMGMK